MESIPVAAKPKDGLFCAARWPRNQSHGGQKPLPGTVPWRVDAPSYSEGDLFAVPLSEGRYAVGIVARSDAKGAVLGYFFGPVQLDPNHLPGAEELDHLRASDAVLVKVFGDLGLVHGNWPIIGQLPSWQREDWPMPALARREELTGRYLRVQYPDDDPNGQPVEVPIEREEYERLPEDGLAGSAWLEARLNNLLVTR